MLKSLFDNNPFTHSNTHTPDFSSFFYFKERTQKASESLISKRNWNSLSFSPSFPFLFSFEAAKKNRRPLGSFRTTFYTFTQYKQKISYTFCEYSIIFKEAITMSQPHKTHTLRLLYIIHNFTALRKSGIEIFPWKECSIIYHAL